MVKQTPFIPYDFLKSDAHGDDGFVFSTGRTLFADEAVVLTPRNLAVQMGFEMSPLLGGKMKGGFVAPRDTVSSEEEEEETTGKMRDVVVEKKRSVVGEPKGTTRCICNKPEKAVAGVMVQWYPLPLVQTWKLIFSGKCEYWLHTRCLKVKARNLPDEWFCPACA
jgi:hypothetical protein